MITLGMIIIGAGLVTAILIYSSIGQVKTEFNSRYMADDNTMGDPDAPVMITEYSSYKCGHCAAFTFETEPLLEEEYIKTGKVYFTHIAIWGEVSAEASYCAGEQNKYWEMREIIFAHQAAPFDEQTMAKWAETVGVEMEQFNNCMANDTYVARVIQDNEESQAAGVEGTPSFVISYVVDGEVIKQMLPGNYPVDAFRQMIDAALAAVGE